MSKVWLITGSSRGLGRSLAEAVLSHGDRLFATARKPEQLNDLVEKYGEQIQIFALDVTKHEQAREAVATAIKAFGRLDVVVNNAGYANITTIEDASEEEWRAQLEANLWGVINVTRAALPILRQQRSGHFLQVSSIGGRTTATGLGPYQTAKWAVEGFSEVLSREVKHLGIKVTMVEPGSFRTDWGGTSMTFIETSEDYKSIMDPIMTYRQEVVGKEPGNPNKAAQALITIVNEENPPLRLPLGSDAFKIARLVDQAKLAETERWESIITSTDYDDVKGESLTHGIGVPQSSTK
ncbi:oxidoreductase [Ktedonospora formicarum]|uniref:Short-chain dehydrogenase/reductase n=1 Tax=Ktedonospora formicarum TaxID=2778364 RepID=A0A8J3MRJ4_9CHLR|nr:oxidoreductase [Ktedonospora formicarum]GHO43678.1 short-chain dehydrogenase/reductase [Ktedonospora formicarum]